MKEHSKNSLRHLAELISQNKRLEEDNFKLNGQTEDLLLEIEKYKNLISKYNLDKKEYTGK